MRLAFIALSALLLASAAGAAYDCPASCNSQPNCLCASSKNAGGLANSDVPMFIVLTNDDAITVVTQPIILNITERHSNRNGCKMPATWFVSVNYTDPAYVQQVYLRGHEIASHTIHHVANPGMEEIVGAKVWLNQTAGIPLEKIQGFRSPFLSFTHEQRSILAANGFRYDSSISESYPSKTSPDSANLLWPYSMDYGIPQDCTISTGTCSEGERHAGLWEFPMWNVQAEDSTVVASMDPVGNMFDLYKVGFDQRYAGNRAPLGIFIHAAWLIADPNHAEELNQFLEYALGHDNVWVVTIQQVLEWQKNPVPASQYQVACDSDASLLGDLPGAKLCVMPSAGCLYGTWNMTGCECNCQNELISGAGGYCKDVATGMCTIQKDYDFVARKYTCPGGASAPAEETSTPTAAPTPAVVAMGKAECGHEMLSYQGLSMTGTADSSQLYAEAMKAIDGSCDTCAAVAPIAGTSAFTVQLPAGDAMTGVRILSFVPTTVTILVGDDKTNHGLANAACATGVAVPANVPTVVPCAAAGTVLTVTAARQMVLCDVYPVTGAAPAAAAPVVAAPVVAAATTAVYLDMDLTATTVADFQATKAAALCAALVTMLGADSTCTVVSVAAAGGRRLLAESVHVQLRIDTADPAAATAAFSNGVMIASLLAPLGITMTPTSLKTSATATAAPVTTETPTEAAAPATPSSSSGGSNIGAIAGGVVGGLAAAAIVAGAVFMVMRRRKAAAAKTADLRTNSFANPAFAGTTASVTLKSASLKGGKGGVADAAAMSASPLRDSMRL